MTGTPATTVLASAGVGFTLREFQHDARSTSYGLEAAAALDVDPDRVFKTLMVDVDDALAVACVPVSCSLDLKAVAASLGGKKAQLAEPSVAQRATGYVIGGISPIGQRTSHPTVVDETAELLDTVLVSAGRRGLDLELTPQSLIAVTGALVAAVSRS